MKGDKTNSQPKSLKREKLTFADVSYSDLKIKNGLLPRFLIFAHEQQKSIAKRVLQIDGVMPMERSMTQKANNLDERKKKALSESLELWPYVRDEARLTAACVQELSKTLGCSRATLYRRLKKLRAEQSADALLPQKRGRKHLSRIVTPEQEEIIETCVTNHFLKPHGADFSELIKRVHAACQDEGLPPLDRSTIKRRLDAISPREVLRKREGARPASEKFDLIKARYVVEAPLQVMQIDHTRMDVLVLNKSCKSGVRRPWLTVCLCVASRCVLGFRISFDPPSSSSLAQAFTTAIAPKGEFLARVGLTNSYPMFGLPQVVHVDNGSDLVGSAFLIGLERFGIVHQTRPIGAPRYGGHIERAFRTHNSFLHNLPGTTGSNTAQRKRGAEKRACLTLNDLERLFTSYICNVYHKTKHENLKSTPQDIWERHWVDHKVKPSLPVDIRAFQLSFMPFAARKIGPYGIRFQNQYYRSSLLQKMKDLGVKSVHFKYDPDDARQIFVEAAKGKYEAVGNETDYRERVSFGELAFMAEKVGRNTGKWSDADLVRHFQIQDQTLKNAKQSRAQTRRPVARSVLSTDIKSFGLSGGRHES